MGKFLFGQVRFRPVVSHTMWLAARRGAEVGLVQTVACLDCGVAVLVIRFW